MNGIEELFMSAIQTSRNRVLPLSSSPNWDSACLLERERKFVLGPETDNPDEHGKPGWWRACGESGPIEDHSFFNHGEQQAKPTKWRLQADVVSIAFSEACMELCGAMRREKLVYAKHQDITLHQILAEAACKATIPSY